MNHRTDKFGGSLENRTRFALLLVEALRKAVPDMIIDYKFSVVTPERGKGGIDEADAPEFAKMLEAAGVDMLHVAQANHTGNMADTIPADGRTAVWILCGYHPSGKRSGFDSGQHSRTDHFSGNGRADPCIRKSGYGRNRTWASGRSGLDEQSGGRKNAVTSANVFPVTRDVR